MVCRVYSIQGGEIVRIYMDACSLNRPFDDLSQDRVYLEAEAVLSIISHCEKGTWTLIKSNAIYYELSNISDAERFEKVQALYSSANERITLTTEAEQRAKHFQNNGVKPFDSIHLALAETYKVDVILTTDDRLLKASKRLNVKIKTANPIAWLVEVMNNEN